MIYPLIGKRILDLAIAIPATILTLPLYPILWAAHAYLFGGNLLFKQQRVGHGGQPFTIYKIRTMNEDGTTSRYTRLLRKTSLDELPQLFNVLKGDMGIVGVRPEMVCKATDGGFIHHKRHMLPPGLTGPTQISVLRRNAIVDNLDVDAAYVDEVSLFKDLLIIARTPLALMSSHTE